MNRKLVFKLLNKVGLTLHSSLKSKSNHISTLQRNLSKAHREIKKLKKADAKTDTKAREKVKVISQQKLQSWSKRVRKVGKCDICNEAENLSAHHLWDKKTHPSLALQDENGVCLCIDCHNKFHQTYTSDSHCAPSYYSKFKVRKQNEIATLKMIQLNSEKLKVE